MSDKMIEYKAGRKMVIGICLAVEVKSESYCYKI